MIIDPHIVDLLEGYGAARWEGRVWRHVFANRDPIAPSHSGGRWAPRDAFGVLYTSLERDGAIAEANFLIGQYSIAPSTQRHICQIDLQIEKVVDLTVDRHLFGLGVDLEGYSHHWGPCPEIGAAANFLGYQGILAPNARFGCSNLIIMMDQIDAKSRLDVLTQEPLRAA